LPRLECTGLHAVLVTPFSEGGPLDVGGLRTLVDFYLDRRAKGLVVASSMGEGETLSLAEREAVTRTVVEHASGRAPVIVGCVGSAEAIAATARQAAAWGARGLLVGAGPDLSGGAPTLIAHFSRLADLSELPLVMVDCPPLTTVIPAEVIAEIRDRVPSLVGIKLEQVPTWLKMAQVRDLCGPSFRILGAQGGLYVPSELAAGSDGLMTGAAFPEYLDAILAAHGRADGEAVHELHREVLPWLVFESQPGWSIALRKAVLRHRGVLPTCNVRRSQAPVPPAFFADVERILGRLPAPGRSQSPVG
jgi:dihydrodipicolinate synthase/N-acetylneuraminate lyase